uniref:Reverse transcriptase domain-containing protein n=1 Tax=Tanacetum cinerariifolium TaxID=118510 RepID=A0A6L2LVG0_TANCI|nr:hypothetical protein [Tanacetum cinerariifolium]
MSEEVFQAKKDLMKSIQTFLDKFNCIPFGEMPKILLQAWENFFAILHAQPEDSNELFQKLLEDLQIKNKELAEYISSSSWNHLTFFNDNEEHSIQYKEYLENYSNEIDASNSNQEKEKPPQDSDIQFYCMHNDVDDLIESALNSKLLSINLRPQCLDKEKHEVKNVIEQPTERGTRIAKSLHNFRIIHEKSSISSVHAITPVLSTKEPDEYEVTSEDKRECDVTVYKDSSTFDVCEDHYEILSDSNDDDISSNNDAFEDVEYVEASPLDSEIVSLEEKNVVCQEDEEFDLKDILQIQDVILREKLLSINRLITDIESLNDNPTPDCVLNASTSIPIFEESKNSLSNNSLLEFETFSDHMEETRSGSTTTHAPEYDSFCFEIEPDQDNSIPQSIRNVDYDSEGDIHFLEELLIDDSIPFLEIETLNFDHQDDPSFPRPPPEPPDVEFLFDLEPNSREVIASVMNNIDELNEDECFDPGGEINVFAIVEDNDYFPFIFVIQNFLPCLIYPKVSPLLLSAESEDTIFDPGISVSSRWI